MYELYFKPITSKWIVGNYLCKLYANSYAVIGLLHFEASIYKDRRINLKKHSLQCKYIQNSNEKLCISVCCSVTFVPLCVTRWPLYAMLLGDLCCLVSFVQSESCLVTFVQCVASWPLYTLYFALTFVHLFDLGLFYTLILYLHRITTAIRQVFGPSHVVTPPVEVELGGLEATRKSSTLHRQIPLLHIHLN